MCCEYLREGYIEIMKVKFDIGRRESFIFLIVSLFLIAGVIAYGLGVNDPQVLGHSHDELINASSTNCSYAYVNQAGLDVVIPLDKGDGNICGPPYGCTVLGYQSESHPIDYFRYLQDGNTFLVFDDYGGLGGTSGSSSGSSYIGGIGNPSTCALNTGTSPDNLVLEGYSSFYSCWVSVCSANI